MSILPLPKKKKPFTRRGVNGSKKTEDENDNPFSGRFPSPVLPGSGS
jgi:hypothetical protein